MLDLAGGERVCSGGAGRSFEAVSANKSSMSGGVKIPESFRGCSKRGVGEMRVSLEPIDCIA